MCTVTIIPLGRPPNDGGNMPRTFRLACNRDESRVRPEALPPRVRRCGERRAVMPTDPAGGGTWVAVNDAGLALALLNVNAGPSADRAAPPPRSRGLIIPPLAGCASAAEAAGAAAELDPADYGPFRLVLVDGRDWAEVEWDGVTFAACRRAWDGTPLLFTSSGLGDALVDPPRRALFDETCRPAPSPAVQDAFHRHRWPDRPHLSVSMSRTDARTVSYTVVEVGPARSVIRYQPVPPDSIVGVADPTALTVRRTAQSAKVLT
jgi:hypothetical protein